MNVIRINGSAAPIRDDGDNLTGVVLTFIDVNKSQRLKPKRNNRDSKRRFGEYLRSLRRHRGWTQSRAGQAVGVDAVTIRRWELGYFSPTSNRIGQVAEAYGVDVAEIIDASEAAEQDESTAFLPIQGFLHGGAPSESGRSDMGTISLPACMSQGHPDAYCLLVRGDNLVPDGIHDGDVLVVWPDQAPSIGSFCVLEMAPTSLRGGTLVNQGNLRVRTAT